MNTRRKGRVTNLAGRRRVRVLVVKRNVVVHLVRRRKNLLVLAVKRRMVGVLVLMRKFK